MSPLSGNILAIILQSSLSFLVLVGSAILIASILIIREIIYSTKKKQSRVFWEVIALMVVFFFTNYLFIAYYIFILPSSNLMIITAIICIVGAFFVYIILHNSLKIINNLSFANDKLADEIESQKANVKALHDKSEALANANARMTQLYLDLDDAKATLEEKEKILQKKNDETSKVNSALANANANISNLFIELEETKEQLLIKKQELTKKNKLLSKSNILLSDIFKKFVPEQFLEKIAKEGIEKISAGYAEKTNLSVLFSDIRIFTTISEDIDPGNLLIILNKYFTYMARQIYANHGFIDKFIGDAIMALYEDTPNQPNTHATNAVNTAIGMHHVLDQINNEINDIIHTPLKFGVGIHTGEVILGTVGFEDRMESTVLGNTVNIASRIESLTKSFGAGIIVSKSTLDRMNNIYKYQYRHLGFIPIRGIQNQMELFEFFDGDAEEIKRLKYRTISHFASAADYLSESNIDKAIKEYKAALEIYPDDTVAKHLLTLLMDRNNS